MPTAKPQTNLPIIIINIVSAVAKRAVPTKKSIVTKNKEFFLPILSANIPPKVAPIKAPINKILTTNSC